MKKFILVPDSFKGTMSSAKVCEIMKKSINNHYPQAEVISIPVADGGEGSVDCFLNAVGGKKVDVIVKDPYFNDMNAFYGILPDNTAVIEMASCAGLPLVGENKHAELTTTFGVGQLMLHAVKNGCKKILMGLGGSATNDGGTGAAAAVGVRFIDKDGNEFVPVGNTLKDICSIDISNIDPSLKDVEISTMCDIDNPLCGENGAAYVFAPQKGADENMVEYLDKSLLHLSEVIKKDIGIEIKDIPGSGAAGGMGGGMVAFFSSSLCMGIEGVLDTVKFNDIVKDADIVFTGEGKIDSQSLRGKVVIGVARRTNKVNVPLISVVGYIDEGIEEAYDLGVTSIFAINKKPVAFSEAKPYSERNLYDTMDNILRTLKINSK